MQYDRLSQQQLNFLFRLQEHMRTLWEQFRNMDARARAPYETKAARDMVRYKREVLSKTY